MRDIRKNNKKGKVFAILGILSGVIVLLIYVGLVLIFSGNNIIS